MGRKLSEEFDLDTVLVFGSLDVMGGLELGVGEELVREVVLVASFISSPSLSLELRCAFIASNFPVENRTGLAIVSLSLSFGGIATGETRSSSSS